MVHYVSCCYYFPSTGCCRLSGTRREREKKGKKLLDETVSLIFFFHFSLFLSHNNRQDQLLNSTYSQSEFTLDEGEKLLKEMQDLREDLSHYSSVVEALYERSREVVPLKQRRSSLRQPIAVTSICIYKQVEVRIYQLSSRRRPFHFIILICFPFLFFSLLLLLPLQVSIGKDEVCKLVSNSSKTKWKVVTSNGVECQVPSVCLLIPPPDPEAAEAADRLKRQYDRCEALWLKKQMRMSQNMIFATIKVVKSWDLSQFMAMGKDQRDAIRKALNEDAEKLLQQGDPNDPQLRRLQREIDEVNQLFDEFERRAAMGNRPELSQRAIGDQLTTLLVQLEESERTLTSRITAPLPRDLDQLEQLVVEHKHFETELQSLQPELESAKENVEACPRKTPSMQTKYSFIYPIQFLLVELEIQFDFSFKIGHLHHQMEHDLAKLEFVHREAQGHGNCP